MSMNLKDYVLNSPVRLAMPVMTHPGIEALGYTVKQAVSDGEIHCTAMEYLADHFPTMAATAIMDLTMEAEAFGAEIVMTADEIPSVVGRLVNDLASVEALQVPDLSAARVPEYLKANKLAVERIKDKPILSGCIGPFSLAGRLFDMSEIMMGIYLEPETITLLLQKCTAFIKEYCIALKAIGTHGVIMAEPAAGLLADEECFQFSSVYVKEIVEAVQDDSFAVILHNCGNSGQCTPAMIASGAVGLHFGNAIAMEEVLEACPSDCLVMGNLDPVGVFRQGSPDSIKIASSVLLKQTASYKNFVISSGCDLPPGVSVDNLNAFFSTIEKFNNV